MSATASIFRRWPERAARRVECWWRLATGYREDDSRLAQDAARYWNAVSGSHRQRAQDAHWRGHGVFADDAVWLKLGRDHVDLLARVLQAHGRRLQPRRVMEWGCGGGMNAVHFMAGVESYHGVDIAPATLAECARQVQSAGRRGFVPVLVDPARPRAALDSLGAPCDLFVCTYVFELLPSEAHALAVLDIARDALAPGGIALLHIRLARRGLGGGSRPWGYARNMAHNVRFTVPVFAQACEARGLRVLDTVQVGEVPELAERDYAYVVVERRTDRDTARAPVPGPAAADRA